VNTNNYAIFGQPAARRCKNGCILEKLVTFDLGTFIGILSDLRVSIDFVVNGDARLCSGLLKYANFKGKNQSV